MTFSAAARPLAIVPAALALLLAAPLSAAAQIARTPPSIEGYATFGSSQFTAAESFEAILGESSGPIRGGGLRIGLGLGGLFFDVGAWRYGADGERAFVFGDEVFPLGIPVDVTVTPIEISAGWRFRIPRLSRVIPYGAGGLTSWRHHPAGRDGPASGGIKGRVR